jgi:hypothetical protein
MVSGKDKFGAFIRREREAKEIRLREMARGEPDLSLEGRAR